MSLTTKIFTGLFLSVFLFVEIAEAGLVRASGRGSQSLNFSQAFYYLEAQHVNHIGIKESSFSSLSSNSIVQAVGGGGKGVGAAPSECISDYVQSDVDDLETNRVGTLSAFQNDSNNASLTNAEYDAGIAAIEDDFDQQLNFLENGEPCVWEFEQGEDLFTFGFFSVFFGTPDVTYDVNWNINGNGTSLNLTGSVNDTGADIVTADGIIPQGSVMLNSMVDIMPGDYNLNVSVSVSSLLGEFFWESSDPQDIVGFESFATCEINPEWELFETNNTNGDPNPFKMETCGHPSIGTNSFTTNPEIRQAPMSFFSGTELLRILPASSGPTANPVNAPASIGIFFVGLVTLLTRRRLKLKIKSV